MAFNLISAPNPLPTAQSDYVAQNNLIAASLLDPHKNFPVDFDNDEILAGTVINLGGAIYKASGTTSISGTKSDYVQVDVSTQACAYVSSLTGVTWNSSYNGYYDGTGNLYLFDERYAFAKGEVTTRNLLASRYAESAIRSVLGYEFVCDGTPFFEVGFEPDEVCRLTDTTFAVLDNNAEEVRTFQLVNGVITQVGSSFNLASIFTNPFCSIAGINSTQIAVRNNTNGYENMRALQWSGSAWSAVGSGLNINANTHYLATLDSTNNEIASYDITTGILYAVSFNGSSFSNDGNISTGTASFRVYAFDDRKAIVASTGGVYSYSWSGSAWSLLGGSSQDLPVRRCFPISPSEQLFFFNTAPTGGVEFPLHYIFSTSTNEWEPKHRPQSSIPYGEASTYLTENEAVFLVNGGIIALKRIGSA